MATTIYTPQMLRGAGTRGVPEVPAGSSTSYLLDNYGSDIAAAYSLRKLSSTYTGSAIQAQIGSAGATFDAGFDSNGYLDSASIAAWNTGDAQLFLEIWYDQSGNVNDADYNSTNRRLQLTDASGNFFTGSNGEMMLYFNEISKGCQAVESLASYFPASGSISFFGIFYNTETSYQNLQIAEFYGTDAYSTKILGLRSDLISGYVENDSTLSQNDMASGTVKINHTSSNLLTFIGNQNPGTSYLYCNTELSETSTTLTIPAIDKIWMPDLQNGGYGANPMEYIVYNADKSSDRVAIETNQDNYYSFTP